MILNPARGALPRISTAADKEPQEHDKGMGELLVPELVQFMPADDPAPAAPGATDMQSNTEYLRAAAVGAVAVSTASLALRAPALPGAALGSSSVGGNVRYASSTLGGTLTLVGIAYSLHGAASSDNEISRDLRAATAGLLVGALAFPAFAPVAAVLAPIADAGAQMSDAYHGMIRHAERLRTINNAGETSLHLRNHLGTDPTRLRPHLAEYAQLKRIVPYLRGLGVEGDLSDPRTLRDAIDRELARLEALPGATPYMPEFRAFVFDALTDSVPTRTTAIPERIEMLRHGRDEELNHYEARCAAAAVLRGRAPARAARLEAFLDASFEIEAESGNPEARQRLIISDIERHLALTREDLGALMDVHNSETLHINEARLRFFLARNEAFLREAGISPISPLRNAFLTMENFIAKAATVGLDADALDRLGLRNFRREAELAPLRLEHGEDHLMRLREGDANFAADRARVLVMLERRRLAAGDPGVLAAIDRGIQAMGGYAALGNYYNIDLDRDCLENHARWNGSLRFGRGGERYYTSGREERNEILARHQREDYNNVREQLLSFLESHVRRSASGMEFVYEESRSALRPILEFANWSPYEMSRLSPASYDATDHSLAFNETDCDWMRRLAQVFDLHLRNHGISLPPSEAESRREIADRAELRATGTVGSRSLTSVNARFHALIGEVERRHAEAAAADPSSSAERDQLRLTYNMALLAMRARDSASGGNLAERYMSSVQSYESFLNAIAGTSAAAAHPNHSRFQRTRDLLNRLLGVPFNDREAIAAAIDANEAAY